MGSRIPDKLYKYRSLANETDKLRITKTFLDNEVYFSPRSEFNDPFDCQIPISWDVTEDEMERRLVEIYEGNPHHPHHYDAKAYVKAMRERGEIRAAISGVGKHVQTSIFNKMGVYCLSANRDSILMWSHYADGHKGICLEFADCGTGFINDGGAHPVGYPESELYPKLKITMHEKDLGLGLILTKSLGWKYESEWRMLDFSGGIKIFPRQCLTGVILGCEILTTNQAFVRELCLRRTTPMIIYRAVKSREKFTLEIEKLESITPPIL
jgi:Protein of unknown function (DUF2971)